MPVLAIVGAGPGMGLAIAKTFGANGYKVGHRGDAGGGRRHVGGLATTNAAHAILPPPVPAIRSREGPRVDEIGVCCYPDAVRARNGTPIDWRYHVPSLWRRSQALVLAGVPAAWWYVTFLRLLGGLAPYCNRTATGLVQASTQRTNVGREIAEKPINKPDYRTP